MSQNTERENQKSTAKSLLILLAIVIAVIYFISKDFDRFYSILLVAIGFGAVIFVHEFGHFAAAKLVDIHVEAFAIGMGPILLAIKKLRAGFQLNILPTLLTNKDGQAALSFVIGRPHARDGETEYGLRLIPVGGFVKMLGQEDMGPDKQSDDPRAFGNKAVWQRSVVIAAGVFMNLISAGIVFMIVFAHGVNLPPAVVGDIVPFSPAARAGIKPGDEIISINDKENINFTDIFVAGALADDNEEVQLTIRRPDETSTTIYVEPADPPDEDAANMGIKQFGFTRSNTLELAEIDDPDVLNELEKLGFKPRDKIVAVNNKPISSYGQLSQMLYPQPGTPSAETITLTAERTSASDLRSQHHIKIPLRLTPVQPFDRPSHILGMIPQLKLVSVDPEGPAGKAGVLIEDIIIRIGLQNNPTISELRDACDSHENKTVGLVVLRSQDEQVVEKTIQVTPKKTSLKWWQFLSTKKQRAVIGVGLIPELDNTIVASCMETEAIHSAELLPRGAIITAIDGVPVKSWNDIMAQLNDKKNQSVQISYHTGDGQDEQSVSTIIPPGNEWTDFTYRPNFGNLIALPFIPLEREFKGKSWAQNLKMGSDMTYSFIAQTYLMLRGMIKGSVSPKAASGPVGILKMSYIVASERPLSFYFYFLSMISVCIAVFNFLPLPILDGGHMLFLVIEKIKGSPVPAKVQEITTYAGLVLLGGLMILVTFQDIIKLFSGQL